MKTTTLKALLMLIFGALYLSPSFAQDVEGDDPAPSDSIVPNYALYAEFNQSNVAVPKIKASSVIHYSDGISVAVELSAENYAPQYAVLANENNASDIRTLNMVNGKAEITGVPSNQVYLVKAMGAEGQQYILGTVNTTPYRAGDPIHVSENLYRALSMYVTPNSQNVTFLNYVKQIADVSQHEKIAFLQQYIMNGATLPGSTRGTYADALVRLAIEKRGETESECLCNFVMNQVTVAVPDETGNFDLVVGEKKTKVGPKLYNHASFWARGNISEGPAKKLLLQNAGKLAGGKRRTETWESGEGSVSDNYVRIGYHLMCIGMNELPRECECDKTVKFDYGYSTRIEARAEAGGIGCVFNNDAASRAQDWAVAVATRQKVNNVSDVQILQSGLGIASSKCSGGVPVSVLVDAAKIGVSVFQLVKSVKTAQLGDIVNQTNQIIDKVGGVLEKVTEIKDCNSAVIEKPLLQGTATLTFKPNDPISFIIMSGSSLEVMGVRCWDSKASVESSFHLAGVVQGGSPTPTTPHCCTKYFANWAYASQSGDINSRKNFVNAHLALNSPGGWQIVNGQPNPTNQANAVTEVGYAIGAALPNGQECRKDVPIFNNPN